MYPRVTVAVDLTYLTHLISSNSRIKTLYGNDVGILLTDLIGFRSDLEETPSGLQPYRASHGEELERQLTASAEGPYRQSVTILWSALQKLEPQIRGTSILRCILHCCTACGRHPRHFSIILVALYSSHPSMRQP